MAVGEIDRKDKALVKSTSDGMIRLCRANSIIADTSSLEGNLVLALAILVILWSPWTYMTAESQLISCFRYYFRCP